MTTIQEARGILGVSNVFGPDEWLRACKKNVSLSAEQMAWAAAIPWSRDILKNPGLDQPHFLFLGLDTYNGKPLSLRMCRKLGLANAQIDVSMVSVSGFESVESYCGFRWYFMPVGVVRGSENLPYDKQTAEPVLPREYEVPGAAERAVANQLFWYLHSAPHTRPYLDAERWALTRDLAPYHKWTGSLLETPGDRLAVRGFARGLWAGVNIRRHSGMRPDAEVGIAASRRILEEDSEAPAGETERPAQAVLPSGAVCSRCGAALVPGAAFCGRCGAAVRGTPPEATGTCPRCGSPLGPAATYCVMCGAPVGRA